MECPVCKIHLEISLAKEQEFLYDCSSCGSSLLLKGDEAQVLNQKDPLKSEEENPGEESPPEVPVLDFSPESLPESTPKEPMKEAEEVVLTQSPEELNEPESLPEEASAGESFSPEKTSSGKEELPSESAPEEEHSRREELSELETFAHEKGGGEALFFYDLTLSEINSPDLKEEVETVLKDEGLKLNFDKSYPLIKDGRLQLKKISPIQVHRIVKSLLGLPLKIKWNQHLAMDLKKNPN